MPHDRYQTVPELADRLEVAEATVRQWIKSGVLRAIDIGKGWRIADTDLERFLKARETAPRESDATAIGSGASRLHSSPTRSVDPGNAARTNQERA